MYVVRHPRAGGDPDSRLRGNDKTTALAKEFF